MSHRRCGDRSQVSRGFACGEASRGMSGEGGAQGKTEELWSGVYLKRKEDLVDIGAHRAVWVEHFGY